MIDHPSAPSLWLSLISCFSTPMSVAFIHSIIWGPKRQADREVSHGRLLHNGKMERMSMPLYASIKSGGLMRQMQLTCDVMHPHMHLAPGGGPL